jgi:hypothetical protein
MMKLLRFLMSLRISSMSRCCFSRRLVPWNEYRKEDQALHGVVGYGSNQPASPPSANTAIMVIKVPFLSACLLSSWHVEWEVL